jgi:hypothetical protein
MGDEIAAFLGLAGVDDELAREVIERARDCDLLGLSRRRHAQVGAHLRPGAGEFEQFQAQADPVNLGGDLASLQRVPRPPPTELFLRNALDNCERLMRTPVCTSISALSRGIVQLRRLATGSSSSGMATRKVASLFTGAGPGATRVFSASMTPKVQIRGTEMLSRTPRSTLTSIG